MRVDPNERAWERFDLIGAATTRDSSVLGLNRCVLEEEYIVGVRSANASWVSIHDELFPDEASTFDREPCLFRRLLCEGDGEACGCAHHGESNETREPRVSRTEHRIGEGI